MREFRIEGQVIDRRTSHGVPGLRVEAWDKDLIVDDWLGSALTAAAGAFTIVFDERHFAGLVGERRPDLFFRVHANGRLLSSTEDSVLWNIDAGTTPVRLEVDMNGSEDPGTDQPAVPTEIPWQLAASSQDATAGAPYDTTVSLFFHEPTPEAVSQHYPNHRLVYLRVAASISPVQADESSFSGPVASVLSGGLPVMNAIVDLRIDAPGIADRRARPYFLAASPTRRTMVETGMVGAESFEGENNGLSIGKSCSQMHETASAHATSETKKASGGMDLLIASAGWSTQSTTSHMNSERSVQQDLQVMNRNASSERRDLTSHMSKVENILSLLTAKHIGSPFLRFSLMPRPLATLSADASDPNLWYSQLLRRRSSGIEGLQEFFAVVAVPLGITQCTVTATLQRIAVLDNPPDPPQTGWRDYTWDRFMAMLAYLEQTYPRGLPVEELDVDLALDPQQFKRPIVLNWLPGVPDEFGLENRSRDVVVDVGDFDRMQSVATRDYKRVEEVALQMYEEDLARSPFERGVVLAHDIELATVFECTEATGVMVTSHEVRVSPAEEREFMPAVPPMPPYLRRHHGPTSVPYQHVHTATNWNLMERQFAAVMTNARPRPLTRRRVASRRLMGLVLERLSRLAADDPRNTPIAQAARTLGLRPEQVVRLAEAGIADLRGLAAVLRRAERETEFAAQVARLNETRAATQHEALQPPAQPLPTGEAHALLDQLARAMVKGSGAARTTR